MMPGTVEKNYIAAISTYVSETNARTAPRGFSRRTEVGSKQACDPWGPSSRLGCGELFPAMADVAIFFSW